MFSITNWCVSKFLNLSSLKIHTYYLRISVGQESGYGLIWSSSIDPTNFGRRCVSGWVLSWRYNWGTICSSTHSGFWHSSLPGGCMTGAPALLLADSRGCPPFLPVTCSSLSFGFLQCGHLLQQDREEVCHLGEGTVPVLGALIWLCQSSSSMISFFI